MSTSLPQPHDSGLCAKVGDAKLNIFYTFSKNNVIILKSLPHSLWFYIWNICCNFAENR